MITVSLSFELYPLHFSDTTGVHILYDNERPDKMIHIAKLPESKYNIHNYTYCDTFIKKFVKGELPEIPESASPIDIEKLSNTVLNILKKKYKVQNYSLSCTLLANCNIYKKIFDIPIEAFNECKMSPYLEKIIKYNPSHEILLQYGLKYNNQMNPEFAYQMLVDYAYNLIETKSIEKKSEDIDISKSYVELLGNNYEVMLKYYKFCIKVDSNDSDLLIINLAHSLYMIDIAEDIFSSYKAEELCEKIYMINTKILCTFGEEYVDKAFKEYCGIVKG